MGFRFGSKGDFRRVWDFLFPQDRDLVDDSYLKPSLLSSALARQRVVLFEDDEGEIQGAAFFKWSFLSQTCLDFVLVDKDHRRKGIGSGLLDFFGSPDGLYAFASEKHSKALQGLKFGEIGVEPQRSRMLRDVLVYYREAQ